MDSAAQLRETIVKNLKSGTWRAGHRIPTERELCDQFGRVAPLTGDQLVTSSDTSTVARAPGAGSTAVPTMLTGIVAVTVPLAVSTAVFGVVVSGVNRITVIEAGAPSTFPARSVARTSKV